MGKTNAEDSGPNMWPHRTQYKTLAENMRAGLKNAQYLAFTGTPLLGREPFALEKVSFLKKVLPGMRALSGSKIDGLSARAPLRSTAAQEPHTPRIRVDSDLFRVVRTGISVLDSQINGIVYRLNAGPKPSRHYILGGRGSGRCGTCRGLPRPHMIRNVAKVRILADTEERETVRYSGAPFH